MLKLSKLEVFSVVSEEGSFSAAAERLHLSQPAVSRHMQELEDTLGIKLFRRMRRGVQLTRGGEVLREYTHEILRLVREAEGALTDVSQLKLGQMRVTTTPGIGVYMLPQWTRGFSQHYPNLTISSSTATTAGVVENVLLGRADLGLVEGEVDGLDESTRLGQLWLQSVEWGVVMRPENAQRYGRHITTRELSESLFVSRQPESQTRQWLERILAPHHIDLRYVAEFDNPEAIKAAVMKQMGVSILPTYVVAREVQRDELRMLPLEGISLERQLTLVWDTERPFSAVTRAFLTNLATQYETVNTIIPPTVRGVFNTD